MSPKVTKFGGYKKQGFVKCLKINNLQSLVVPRAGTLTISRRFFFYFRGILRDSKAWPLGALVAVAYVVSYVLLQMETYAFLGAYSVTDCTANSSAAIIAAPCARPSLRTTWAFFP